jgi:hypothetical protein
VPDDPALDPQRFRNLTHRIVGVILDDCGQAYDIPAVDHEHAAHLLRDVAQLVVAVAADRDDVRGDLLEVTAADRTVAEELIVGHLLTAAELLRELRDSGAV